MLRELLNAFVLVSICVVIHGGGTVLLCGLSGAFIFTVVNVLYQARLQQRPVKTYSSFTPQTH